MAIHGEVARGPLLLLGAMFVLSLTLSPLAVSAALRISQE
jgi:ABC-type transport system involved in cytochrome c biogenesis permease component